ncbi:MAG: ATP-binding protein [Sulfuritalea sp.]|jgi:signal transduction histidine kinase|nr:ATP-binding protein [Sulfuritalea sp.]
MNSPILNRYAETNPFSLHSLKTRVTLFTLAIFVVGLWLLAFYASRELREDMQRLLGEQQSSTVSFVATEINQELENRLGVLGKVAGIISPAILGNPAHLQTLLKQRLILQGPFNAGVVVVNSEGTGIADTHLSAGRIGGEHSDVATIATALNEGKSTIGHPHLAKNRKSPEFGMAVPIRDSRGKVIGALAGVTDLGQPNFLGNITQNRYGTSGGYLLIAPRPRLIVSATDKSRVMEALPAPGVSPWIDRAVQGYEGTNVFRNPLGIDVLTSVKAVPVTGWIMVVALPVEEAFAPIRAMQQRMMMATILLTLLAGSLTWWMLKRQLSPMLTAVRTLAALSDDKQPLQPLPITRQDEIGDLLIGFNRLLETLGRREEALKRSNVDLQRFAEVTAHHLQEPARRMATYAERLTRQLNDGTDDGETRLSLDFIGQEARRQKDLLRDIERYLAADQPRNKVKSVDARQMVTKILARAKDRIGAAGAEITVGELPPAWIDAPRLVDLFEAMLDNALQHGSAESRRWQDGDAAAVSTGAPLKITIDGEHDGALVRYRVSDNGPGIEEQYRERVFRVFERLSSGGDVASTGIGLAIVRRIAESCGGRAWIEETPGGGCRVLFELPVGVAQ